MDGIHRRTVLADFTQLTGIKVVYETFDTNDVLESKLLAGGTGYDLVFPGDTFLSRQVQAGVFAKLDKSKIPNWKNLDPQMMQRAARFDPGNAYGAIYLWGTTGIAYNEQMIKERMPDAPVNSWRMVFDPEVAKRFADCGVYMLDAPDEIVPTAPNYIGEEADSEDYAVIAKAEPVLAAVRPYIRGFHSSENIIAALTNGDICLAVTWSGDAGMAATRAEEAGVPASMPMIDREIAEDPMIYPPPELREKLFVLTPHQMRTQRTLTKLWERVLTGP